MDPDGRQANPQMRDPLEPKRPHICSEESDMACRFAVVKDQQVTVTGTPVTHGENSSVPEDGFASAIDAGRAGLSLAARMGEGRSEYLGVVLEQGGRFWYTMPVTTGENRSVSVTFLGPDPGFRWAGLWFHVHPYGDLRTLLFSSQDVRTSQGNQWTALLGTFQDNSVRRFDPTSDKVGVREYQRYGMGPGNEQRTSAQGTTVCENCLH